MSYLVLARKYRPANFGDIVGQEHVVRTLQNAIELDRVHHAFLFTGARGVGKTTTARVLARALNCENGPTPNPCGECAACKEIAGGTSPDVLEIDGASNTGVDNVRELRETVRYLPSRGRFKLYIIDEVHMLSQAAFNALLKTLEEPPSHVKFIFATTEPQKIPVTILSRCQRFDFRRVSVRVLGEHVRAVLEKEGVTLSPNAVTAITREAQGSVRDALSLLDQVLSYAGDQPTDEQVVEALGVVDREALFALADAILTRDAQRLLEGVAEIDARGHDPADLASLLVEHLRDLMVVKVVDQPSEALLDRSPGELEALTAQGHKATSAELHRMFTLLVTVAEDVARSNFPRVSLEMGLLRLLEVEPAQNLETLLERLDGLVGGAGPVSAKASPKGSPRAAQAGHPRADERRGTLRDGPAVSSQQVHGAGPGDAPSPFPATPPSAVQPPHAHQQGSASSARDAGPARDPNQAQGPNLPRDPNLTRDPISARDPSSTRDPGVARAPSHAEDATPAHDSIAAQAPNSAGDPHPAPVSAHDPHHARDARPPNPAAGSNSAPHPAPGGAESPEPPELPQGDDRALELTDTQRSQWERVVQRVREMRPALASVLEHGSVLTFGVEGVVLGFPRDTFYWESARDADNKALVQQALDEQFGTAVPLTLKAVHVSEGTVSLAAQRIRERQERLDEIREAALNDPAVRSATRILGAEVRDVVTLADDTT